MQFVDPQPAPSTPAEPYDLAASLDAGATIGLYANGFPDSVAFLDQVEAVLGERLEQPSFIRMNKGDASRLATADEVAEAARRCDAVIGAYGH